MDESAEYVVSCIDPERCQHCPPDRVCAWACQQGWSAVDAARFAELAARLPAASDLPPMPELSETACLAEALWDAYN